MLFFISNKTNFIVILNYNITQSNLSLVSTSPISVTATTVFLFTYVNIHHVFQIFQITILELPIAYNQMDLHLLYTR